MKAKKSLGQHFLRSERALSKIVESGEIESKDLVLEIGPGQGALTEKLLPLAKKVIAVEKDDELYKELEEKFKKEISLGKLKLVHGDILEFDTKDEELKKSDYKIIANIPYNITGAILKKFLSSPNQPKLMVLLVQKEVAKRITSKDKESLLSLSVKVYGEPFYIEKVLAGSFIPRPKVDSAIILIDKISKDFFKNIDEETFFSTIKAGFSSKRKKLSSNLNIIYAKETVSNVFKKLNLDPNTRAEDINISIWKEIALNLYKH